MIEKSEGGENCLGREEFGDRAKALVLNEEDGGGEFVPGEWEGERW